MNQLDVVFSDEALKLMRDNTKRFFLTVVREGETYHAMTSDEAKIKYVKDLKPLNWKSRFKRK